MMGVSSLLDRAGRAGVALLLRGDRRGSPRTTALLLLNPVEPLTAFDPLATRELLDAADAARHDGSTVVIALTASGGTTERPAALASDLELPRTGAHSAFRGTGLDELLRRRGIDRLRVAGFPTNIDVDTTARHAVELGYHVTVLAHACAAHTRAEHEASADVTLPRIVHAVSRGSRSSAPAR